jgi:hypothetical protein
MLMNFLKNHKSGIINFNSKGTLNMSNKKVHKKNLLNVSNVHDLSFQKSCVGIIAMDESEK